jgi:drug/metabolite transporter (DMT)-like permease
VAIVLALLCACAYGTGDFFGGLATRRVGSAFAVVLGSQAVSLLFVVVVAPLFGGHPHAADMAWAALGGVAGAVGLVSFYQGLAIGPMSITAPVSAVIAAVVPVLVGIVSGERPGTRALVGIPIAIVAIVLFSTSPATEARHVRATPASFVYAVVAGVGFGTFFVFLAQVRREAELFPLFASRGASITAVVAVALTSRRSLAIPRPSWLLVGLAGVFDITANALFLLASGRGLLAVVSVLASLYPAATVILARAVLHERLTRRHAIASIVTATAVVLIASG